jgi:hypothetical protein
MRIKAIFIFRALCPLVLWCVRPLIHAAMLRLDVFLLAAFKKNKIVVQYLFRRV